jgi:hypothetical protein
MSDFLHCEECEHAGLCRDSGLCPREGSGAAPCSVLTVSEEEHTADCPKCGGLLHAEKIHMDNPHCYFCGKNLRIEIPAPNPTDQGS